MASVVPTAAGGAAADGALALSRTAWRRLQRQAYRKAVREKIAAEQAATRLACAQRDQLLGASAAAEGSVSCLLDPREQAVVAALRLHVAACMEVGRDEHWAGKALAAAQWCDQVCKDVLARGAVARHHGLATVSAEAFSRLDRVAVRQL